MCSGCVCGACVGQSDEGLAAVTGPQMGLRSGQGCGLPVDSTRFLGPRVSPPPPWLPPQRNGVRQGEEKGLGAPLFCEAPAHLGVA